MTVKIVFLNVQGDRFPTTMTEQSPEAKSPKVPTCKIVLLGAPGVGKTSLINRFMYEQFSRDYDTTVGIDYFTKKIKVGDKLVSLRIWDTAGQEQYLSLIPTYIRDTQIAVIVYDVSDPKSYELAKTWHKHVIDARGDDAQCILAGNKIDLESQVDDDLAKAGAEELGMKWAKVSAKTGDGVQELFREIVELVPVDELERREATSVLAQPVPLTPAEKAQKEGSCC